MFGLRVLLFLVSYVVVIAEIIVGARSPDKIIWIVPGGLVISLLLAISLFLLTAHGEQGDGAPKATFIQWITLLLAGMLMSTGAFYFQGVVFPFLMANT